MNDSAPSPNRDQFDPLVLHARREALVILLAFGGCLIWSVGWCYLWGYPGPDSGPVSKVLGMPSWVFWGVLAPWIGADLFAVWFCFFFFADDPLGEVLEETPPEEKVLGDRTAGQIETQREDRHD